MTDKARRIETGLQHPRRSAAPGGEPVSQPVYQSSTYVLPTPELGAEIAASWHPQRFYTRYGSPNVAQVEATVAELEGAEDAVAVGSGMAAIAAAILAHVRAGDHVVAQTGSLYRGALPLCGLAAATGRRGHAGGADRYRRVSPSDRFEDAPRVHGDPDQPDHGADGPRSRGGAGPRPRRACRHRQHVCLELQSASAHPRRHFVVHSATKYLNGHSDVTAGVVTGARKFLEPVWEYARVHGPVLHPMEAWLLGRGLKTYALRMR